MDTLEKLDALRTELIELSFALERRGRLDAADIALETSHRIAAVCDELASAGPVARRQSPPQPVAVFAGQETRMEENA